MNRTGIGVVGAVLVLIVVVLLLSGTTVSCRESFWDRNKQVIEINR